MVRHVGRALRCRVARHGERLTPVTVPWWTDRRRLPDLPPVVRRHATATASAISTGIRAPPRPPGVARRRRHLAVAVLPLADGRLRLRRHRLLRRRSACSARSPTSTRLVADAHDRGLRVLARLGAEPHLRPAPVVRRVPLVAATTRSATGTSGATPRPTAGRRTTGSRSLERPAGVDLRRGHRPVLPAPLPARAARPRTGPNPEVEAAMHDVLRFWLDRGVDGFRMDVVHCIGKDPALPDDPPELAAAAPRRRSTTAAETHALLRGLRGAARRVPRRPDDGRRGLPARHRAGRHRTTATATSCTWRSTSRRCSRRVGRRPLARARSTDGRARSTRIGAWPTWVLSNHDNPRHRTRYGDRGPGPGRRGAAARRLRGTPFLYAGEELGLEDAVVPRRPGGRSRRPRRLPGADPVDGRPRPRLGHRRIRGCRGRPTPTRATSSRQRADPASILHLYRRLLAARRDSPGPRRRAIRCCSRRRTGCWRSSGCTRPTDDSCSSTSPRRGRGG